MQFAAERSAQTNAMSGGANTLNDGRLVVAAKNEHSTAFATLSDQYKEHLFRTAHRITRTREDAEDAVQDTLLRAFVHMGDFEGRSNFGTWLTRIAINSALMILRRKRASLEIAIGHNNDSGGDDLCYEITDDAPNPETRYAQTEAQRILRTAIQRLRPNLRVVVQIHLQGRSIRETAEALGISLSAAKGRLFHAKNALRKSVPGRVADQPRFAGKFMCLAPGLLGDRHLILVSPLGAVESEKKGDEDAIEIHGTSKRRTPSNFCPQGEAVNISAAASPGSNQNSSI
jgi:RNA polymerase sigma-70 factor, ECF subfamily